MVSKKNLFITLAIALIHTQATAAFDAKSLKESLANDERTAEEKTNRLKASRSEIRNIKLLNEDELIYKLPNGEYVKGMLLPNSKIAPAIQAQGMLIPACVTKTYQLMPGTWDNKKQAIRCNLSQSELAVLSASGVSTQFAAYNNANDNPQNMDSGQKKQSSKYKGAAGEKNTTQSSSKKSPAKKSNKYSQNKSSERKQGSKYSSRKNQSSNSSSSYEYVPPPRNPNKGSTVAGVMPQDKNLYGISIGTWAKAKLERTVSSAESGMIEFVLTESIKGRHQTLPQGTILFANKSINERELKMECITLLAKTPSGEEISGVSFRIYSLDKRAGLAGQVVRDREKEVKGSAKKAALKTASIVAASSGSLAGTAATSVADDMISNEGQFADSSVRAFIRVSPQPVLLKLTKTF